MVSKAMLSEFFSRINVFFPLKVINKNLSKVITNLDAVLQIC